MPNERAWEWRELPQQFATVSTAFDSTTITSPDSPYVIMPPIPDAPPTQPCVRSPDCANQTIDFNRSLCDDCAVSYFHCPCPCRRVLLQSRGRSMPSLPGGWLCQRYYNANYFTCVRCEDVSSTMDRRYCIRCNMNSLCFACKQTFHRHPAATIHNYGHRPPPNFLGGSGDALFLGVELEVDNSTMSSDQLQTLWNLSNNEQLFYLKTDGSLRNGFELVTHPATLAYHRRKMPWKDALFLIKDYGYQSHRTTTCGLHVHASKLGLGKSEKERDQTLNKLMILFWRHWENIAIFSRRTPDKLNTWARPNHSQGGLDVPILKKLVDCKYTPARYVAINTSPEHTIEFRLFRGTLEKVILMAAIEFVQTAIDLCRANGTSWVYNSKWEDIVAAGSQYLGLDLYFKRLAKRNADAGGK